MQKFTLIIFAILSISFTHAMSVEELGDSLTCYAKQKASVGKVKVSDIQVNKQHIDVYTNGTLACISLSPEEVNELKQQVSQWVIGSPKGKVAIYSADRELEEYITTRFKKRDKKLRAKVVNNKYPLVKNISLPYSAEQGLDGRHIALWGSHGIYYVQAYQMWKWQRARLWTTIEDLYTSSYTSTFLVPMLENAGAVVIQPRERDTQLHEVIVDDAQLSEGITPVDKSIGWGPTDAPLLEGDNPFTMGGYSVVNTQAVYTPELPAAGEYAVYVSYKSLPKSNQQAEYTVVHQGVKTTYHINQQMGGGTWIYVGTFAFGTDKASNYVTLAHKGKNITTTDAIKFGGGWGSVARYPYPGSAPDYFYANRGKSEKGEIDSLELIEYQALATTSGYPRYIEGARYWMQYAGIPDSVYNYTHSRNDYTDDFSCRGRWVNYLAGGSDAYKEGLGLNIPINMSIAFHSDAGDRMTDELVGTLVAYTDYDDDKETTYPAGGDRICNRDIADFIQTQIVEDIRSTFSPEWPRRNLWPTSLSESRNPKVPCMLIELLSHHNYYDMKFGLDPKFKFVVSRAIYKGMLRFMHECTGTDFVVQPLPVKKMQVTYQTNNTLSLSWEDRIDMLESTANPTHYVLYTRASREKDGAWVNSDWDNGRIVNDNQLSLPIERGVKYDFMVRAANAGGVSMPSETLSAYIAPQFEGELALIINGFTRVDAPDMIGIDSITGGVIPGSYAVPYGKEISFIGEQYDYDRQNRWESDDDCGFGMCYADKQKEVNMGNTFDYPTLHGKTLAQMGVSYVSSSAEAVTSLEPYALVDIIMGKQKSEENDTIGCIPMHLRDALTHYTAMGGKVLLSGSYIGSDMRHANDTAWVHNTMHYTYKTDRASRSGKINVQYNVLPKRQYDYYAEPNPHMIECEAPDGIEPKNGSRRIGRYEDTYVCAGVAYEDDDTRILVLPFVIESVKQFDTLYSDCINWLMNN